MHENDKIINSCHTVFPAPMQRDKQEIPVPIITLPPGHTLRPSKVFDTYWNFAKERQDIFFKRIMGAPPPWSNDLILQTYKFTNAYRASDRVSQYLIRNVIYDAKYEPEDVLFRILLFKTFNKIETWEVLTRKFGTITYRDFDPNTADEVLLATMKSGRSIYSGAYIMPSGGRSEHPTFKHRTHIEILLHMMKESLLSRILSTKSLNEVFSLLKTFPLVGDFLAYQYSIDINYSELIDFSESSFVVPGPGARNGIRKCFLDSGGICESDIIKLVTDLQEEEFSRLGLQFKDLWGRSLQLIDCQNLFCEVDKYARVAHPSVQGITNRHRIKHRFSPKFAPVNYWYPPKWGLNDRLPNSSKNDLLHAQSTTC